VALWSTLVAIAGIAVASFLYLGPRTQAEWLCGVLSRPWSGFAYQLSRSKFFFDEIYDVLIVRPARGLGQVLFVLDRYLVDGLVDAVGSTPGKFGALVRRLQCGFTPYYGFGMLFGAIVLALVCWLWEA
jgi:NADH-quinone oxidoreductase subunit L